MYVEELSAACFANLFIEATDSKLHTVSAVTLAIYGHQIDGPVIGGPVELVCVRNGERDILSLLNMTDTDGLSAVCASAGREFFLHGVDDREVVEFICDRTCPAEYARERTLQIRLRRFLPDVLGKKPCCFEEEEKALALQVHCISLTKKFLQIGNLALKVHGS